MVREWFFRGWLIGFATLAAISVIAVTLHAAMLGGSTRQEGRVTVDLPIGERSLVIYSGRAESLVGGLIDAFERETGIRVKVKCGRTGPLASLILEEGRRSPADVFFAQDPGGLGMLADAGRLRELPESLCRQVPYAFVDHDGRWVGVTGRLRAVGFATDRVDHGALPNSVLDLADPRWVGRVGWAPSNASFQAMVSAMRHDIGESRTEQWLVTMRDAGTKTYASNTAILQGILDGEIDLGLVNHYYIYRFHAERENLPLGLHLPPGPGGVGDLGGTLLVSGAAIVDTARHPDAAHKFIEYLLRPDIQELLTNTTFEYPLAHDAQPNAAIPPLASLPVATVSQGSLSDLEQTVSLLRRTRTLQ